MPSRNRSPTSSPAIKVAEARPDVVVVVDGAGGFVNREEYTPYGETSFGSARTSTCKPSRPTLALALFLSISDWSFAISRPAVGGHPLLLWDNYPVNDAMMADRQVRPTALQPLWKAAGFALGLAFTGGAKCLPSTRRRVVATVR